MGFITDSAQAFVTPRYGDFFHDKIWLLLNNILKETTQIFIFALALLLLLTANLARDVF